MRVPARRLAIRTDKFLGGMTVSNTRLQSVRVGQSFRVFNISETTNRFANLRQRLAIHFWAID